MTSRNAPPAPNAAPASDAAPGSAASGPAVDPSHGASGRRYIYAWLALLVLTVLSFGADRLHLGSLSTGIALGVALIKASIVFVVFMHLDREPFPIRFVAGLNVAWVLLLCLGVAADVGTIAGSAAGDAAAVDRR
jgi:cytochrome c oxidase subunit 4